MAAVAPKLAPTLAPTLAPNQPPNQRLASGLPAAEVVQAPVHWQQVDLLSDLHLSAQMPRTQEALIAHLRHTTAQAVFILGDVFELWVGDDVLEHDSLTHQLLGHIAGALRTNRHRPALGVMVGNRDFLLGPKALAACGAFALADPTLLCAGGQRVVLTHGDALCLNDGPYQQFRAQVRQPAWQAEFLSKPLAARLEIARGIRHASANRQAYDGAADADVDTPAALQLLRRAGARTLVHGHTHRPARHPLPQGAERWVLSDWDFDGPGQARAQVLRLSATGLAVVAPAVAAA